MSLILARDALADGRGSCHNELADGKPGLPTLDNISFAGGQRKDILAIGSVQ